jgi:hypothetical protein
MEATPHLHAFVHHDGAVRDAVLSTAAKRTIVEMMAV